MQNQERLKVLEMLAAGKINVEQADQLLELLNAKTPAGDEGQSEPFPRTGDYTREPAGKMGRVRGTWRATGKGERETGLPGLSIEQAKALKNHMVSVDYIRELAEVGLADLSVEQLIALKNHLVNAKYVASLHEAGLTDLSVEQLIALKNHMVSAKYVASLHEAGLNELGVEQIIALKNYAVNPQYVASLREAGLTNLTIEQIISLSMYQIDPSLIDPQQIAQVGRFSSRFSLRDLLKG
jgi:hypothetical protein